MLEEIKEEAIGAGRGDSLSGFECVKFDEAWRRQKMLGFGTQRRDDVDPEMDSEKS